MALRKPQSKSTPGPQTSIRKLPPWTPHLALGALAFAVYANSLAGGFITDDQFQILNNPVVTGAQSLGSAFGSGVWAFLGYRGNYFRPLQFVIYGLIYRAFGPNALAFHLLMVVLHAVNTALVYSLARRLLAGRVPAAAWVAAASFRDASDPYRSRELDRGPARRAGDDLRARRPAGVRASGSGAEGGGRRWPTAPSTSPRCSRRKRA